MVQSQNSMQMDTTITQFMTFCCFSSFMTSKRAHDKNLLPFCSILWFIKHNRTALHNFAFCILHFACPFLRSRLRHCLISIATQIYFHCQSKHSLSWNYFRFYSKKIRETAMSLLSLLHSFGFTLSSLNSVSQKHLYSLPRF